MAIPAPTVDELISALGKSSIPTVLCEGNDDLAVLRFIEERIGTTTISFLPCGGRTTLLAISDRRAELAGKRLAFLADRDFWLFSGVPPRYGNVIVTWGYSIENDVLAGSGIERLLTANERQRHEGALREIVRWFAFEVDKHNRGAPANVDVNVARILQKGIDTLCPKFTAEIGFVEPPPELHKRILDDAGRVVRGKTLVELLVRFLSHQNRVCKYSRIAVLEICVKLCNNVNVRNIVDRIKAELGL